MSRYGTNSGQGKSNHDRYRNGIHLRRRDTLPPVTSPDQAPEEIDEAIENRSGSRSRKRMPKPLRFFPHLFPVPTTLYGVITVIGGVLLLGVLFFQVHEILSPFLLAVAAGVLFYPFRKEPKIRPLLLAGAIVFLVWFLYNAAGVLLPFLISFLLAYIVEPLVTWLSRRWYIQRWISALAVTLLLVGVIVISIVYITPVLIEQVGMAVGSFDGIKESLLNWAHTGGLSEITGVPQEKVDAMVQQHLAPSLDNLDKTIIGVASDIGKSVPGYLSSVLNFLMIPFVMFYFVKDYWKVRGSLYSFMPQEYQRASRHFMQDLDEVVGGFLRGDLITSVFQGVFIGVGLSIIGVPGALLLGILTGILCLIPFVGAYIAYALALIGALTTQEPAIMALYVTILFAVQGLIEATVIGPQVMGRHTDLHPILVILALIVFGYFMGIVGMLLAIPVTSLIVRFATRWRDDRRARLEEEKVRVDLEKHPEHARKGDIPPVTA